MWVHGLGLGRRTLAKGATGGGAAVIVCMLLRLADPAVAMCPSPPWVGLTGLVARMGERVEGEV